MALTEMVIMPGADYQAICDAVRAKTGGADLLKSGEVAGAIEGIESGGGEGVPSWVTKVYEIEIGANTVTNAADAITYMKTLMAYNQDAAFLKTVPDTNNQLVVFQDDRLLRFRDGSIIKSGVTDAYDAILVEGTKYVVWEWAT